MRFATGCWILGAVTWIGACTVSNPHLSQDTDNDDGTGTSGSTSRGELTTTTATTMTSAGTSVSATTTGEPDPMGSSTSTSGSSTSGSTGVAPVCPSDTHACVDAPPQGWDGPAAVVTAAVGRGQCGGNYPTPLIEGFEDLVAADAECTCSCGNATGVSCANPVLEYHGSDSNCFGSGVNHTLSPGCNNIGNQNTGTYWEVDSVGVTGGNCDPIDTENVDPPSYTTGVTACGGAEDIGGCDEGLCVPKPVLPFPSTLCVAIEGDVSCPSGYPEKTLRHDAIADDRGCSTCTCGNPQGTCGGHVSLNNSNDCSATFSSGTVGVTGTCTQAVAAVGSAIWNPGTATASCTESGGQPMGAATPDGPITFCCQSV